MTLNLTIAYHSTYGHTAKLAHAIKAGILAKNNNVIVNLLNVTEIKDSDWDLLDQSHAIIFGCPTYMGGVSAQFKQFIDSASKKWFEQKWKNKIAAGFTNSGGMSGDKLNSLFQLVINACQHGMIWVGNAVMAAQGEGVEGPNSNQLNRVGSWLGLAAQANNVSPDLSPPAGDIETAKLFGTRILEITTQFNHK